MRAPVRPEEELIRAMMETLVSVKHLLISKFIEVLLCMPPPTVLPFLRPSMQAARL